MMVVTPVTVVPVMAMPAVVTPVAVVPVMVAMPAHLHGLHLVDFVLRHDRRLNVCHGRHGDCLGRDRRHGCGLCSCSKQDRAHGQASSELQEIPKFHDFMPLSRAEREDARSVLPPQNERSLNSSMITSTGAQNGSSVAAKFCAIWRDR